MLGELFISDLREELRHHHTDQKIAVQSIFPMHLDPFRKDNRLREFQAVGWSVARMRSPHLIWRSGESVRAEWGLDLWGQPMSDIFEIGDAVRKTFLREECDESLILPLYAYAVVTGRVLVDGNGHNVGDLWLHGEEPLTYPLTIADGYTVLVG